MEPAFKSLYADYTELILKPEETYTFKPMQDTIFLIQALYIPRKQYVFEDRLIFIFSFRDIPLIVNMYNFEVVTYAAALVYSVNPSIQVPDGESCTIRFSSTGAESLKLHLSGAILR